MSLEAKDLYIILRHAVLAGLTALAALWLTAETGRTRIVTSPSTTSASNSPCSGPCVLTYHDDLARDGVTSNETVLTPSGVNNTTFGRIATITGLNGQIYAQPLYMSGMYSIAPAGNVVFLATEQDWVYAFDADVYAMIWGNSYIPAQETPVPTGTGQALPCPNIYPVIGITSTPVIDSHPLYNANPVIYFVTKSVDVSLTYHQRLHAVDVTNGSELFGGPVEITTPAGAPIAFDTLHMNQRAGLVLTYDSTGNPQIYLAWGSHCDTGAFHGWIMEFKVSNGTLSTVPVNFFLTTVPTGVQAGVWQSGAAPAADNAINGNLIFNTGNGTYNGTTQFGETVLKLTSNLTLADWYTPNNYKCLNGIGGNANCPTNQDLGSGGVVLFNVPNGVPELAAGGKSGEIYVIYQSNMGHLDPAAVNANYAPPTTCTTGPPGGNNIAQCYQGILDLNGAPETGSRGNPAFWNSILYVVGSNDKLRAYGLSSTVTGTFNTTAAAASVPSYYLYPGASPAISWNGSDPSTGIVWVLQTSGYSKPKPSILRAYAGVPNGGSLTLLYQSTTAPGAVKFVVPTIANGKVFVAGQGLTQGNSEGRLYVYGLCPCK